MEGGRSRSISGAISGACYSVAAENEDTFTEEEVFQALSWGMPEAEARRLSKFMADDPTSPERIRFEEAEGPSEGIYSEDLLVLLSLVSSKAQRTAELRVARQRLQSALTPEQSAEWEARRSRMRQALIDSGERPGN
jgi:hypothetical protein